MTYNIYIHPDAKQDLMSMIANSQHKAVAIITTIIEQINNDPDLFDRLTQHGFGVKDIDSFNVKRWHELWNAGYNVLRMRIWDMEDVGANRRIIYLFLPQERCCYVVGVVPREFNYEKDHIITHRIRRACDQLRDEYGY